MQLLYNIINFTQSLLILQINNIDYGRSLYLLSDLGMAISYYLIAIISIYLLINQADLYARRFVFLLIVLNLFSGFNYIIQLFNIVWLSSSIKLITAIISMLTAIKIGTLIPKLLTVPESEELVTANEKLAEEIQEHQQTEIALQKSEAIFSSIFAKSALGIAVLDPDGNTLETNPALQEMLGYNELELRQLKRAEYVHPEDILTTNKLDQELMLGTKESYQIEKRFLRKDGEILWGKVTVSLVKDNQCKPEFIIRMIENITHRKQTEIKLAEYQKYLEDLLGERNQQLSKTNEQLSWQSTHDSLTNLINRSEFEKLLGDAVLTAKNYQEYHSLCYIDVDQFKIINDTCGHLAGDELLKEIAKLLNYACRKTDILARIGGDEFAVILYRCNLAQGLRVAQIIQEKIDQFNFVWQGKSFKITVSIGLGEINIDSDNIDSVINACHAACENAKDKGGNRVYVYHNNDQELAQQQSQIKWLTRINEALTDNRFCLYYQTISSLNYTEKEGNHYEILLRLLDDNGELITPINFIPAAERYNLMPAIDRWVISNFFATLKQALLRGSANPKSIYAINLSGASVSDDKLINFLKEQFQFYQIPPEMICFEITETLAIANLNQAVQLIYETKNIGCGFALDDFGSGMCSFGYLKYLPVDYLKIDGQFIKDIAENPIDYAMVEAINRIGKVMGLKTIAEFVSSQTILEKIKEIGVDYAQGYHISHPKKLKF